MAKPDYFVDIGPPADDATDLLNNASSELSMLGGCDNNETDLTVIDATRFVPQSADHRVYATLDDGTNQEVVRVVSVAGNILTVVRDVEGDGATGYAFDDSTPIERRLTHGMLQELSPYNPSSNDVEIGRDTASGVDGVSIGQYAVATGARSIRIGSDNTDSGFGGAIGAGSVAIGYRAYTDVTATDAVALGTAAIADAGGSKVVVIGDSADANHANTVAIGADTVNRAASAAAIGDRMKVYHMGSFAAPPRIIGRTGEGYDPTAGDLDATGQLGGVTIIAFPPTDLGVVPDWTATTAYTDQNVVEQATPAGTEQFFYVVTDTDWYGAHNVGSNAYTSGAAEPTFAVAAQGDVTSDPDNSQADWVMIDPKTGITLAVDQLGGANPGQTKFIPKRVGFYCFSSGAINDDATFNFGNENSATEYLTGAALDDLTASSGDEIQWFDVEDGNGVVAAAEDLVITLTVSDTGASLYGRFVVEGYYIALPS